MGDASRSWDIRPDPVCHGQQEADTCLPAPSHPCQAGGPHLALNTYSHGSLQIQPSLPEPGTGESRRAKIKEPTVKDKLEGLP